MRLELRVDPAWPGRALLLMALVLGGLALFAAPGPTNPRALQGLAAAMAAGVVVAGWMRRRRRR